jgi:putative tricarboxylic transport membrane protein
MRLTSSKPAVLGVTALSVVLAVIYLAEALRYSRGSLADPGPGLYPLLVGALILLGAAGSALEVVRRPTTQEVEWPEPRAGGRLLAILAAVVGYVVALVPLGHAVAGTAAALAILHAMGMRAWWRKGLLALLAGVGSFVLFDVLLDVPLPAGTVW